MRKALSLAVLACLAAFSVRAQQPDAIAQLRLHPEHLDGTDYLCPTDAVDLTPAPAGYEAFYVSHYGRHGARYARQSDMYTKLNDVFLRAYQRNNLYAQRKR